MNGMKLAEILMNNEECTECGKRYIHIDFKSKEDKIEFKCECGFEKIIKGEE